MPDETAPTPEERTFEEVLADLTRVVERLEKGNLPLQESLTLYTKGVELLRQARKTLDQAQARLEVLLSATEEGLETEPLDPEEFLKEG